MHNCHIHTYTNKNGKLYNNPESRELVIDLFKDKQINIDDIELTTSIYDRIYGPDKLISIYNELLNVICYLGHINVIDFILNKGVNQLESGLEYACLGGHIDIVKLMIKKINETATGFQSPESVEKLIMTAYRRGYLKISTLLFDEIVFTHLNEHVEDIIENYMKSPYCRGSLVRHLLLKYIDTHSDDTIYRYLKNKIFTCDGAVLKSIFEHVFNPEVFNDILNRMEIRGYSTSIIFLKNMNNKQNINIKFRNACESGDLHNVKSLINHITEAQYGLYAACSNGHIDIINEIINRKFFDIDGNYDCDVFTSAIKFAYCNAQDEVVKLIVDMYRNSTSNLFALLTLDDTMYMIYKNCKINTITYILDICHETMHKPEVLIVINNLLRTIKSKK